MNWSLKRNVSSSFFFLLCITLLNVVPVYGLTEIEPKKYSATLLSSPIKIDGKPIEDVWKSAKVATNFTQLEPVEGNPASQVTEVRVLYDNDAIYISAMLFDTMPDSILHQLGNRDQSGSLNSDAFRFGLDPYNQRQAGYVFELTASGVQSEAYNDDLNFDAVWESAVHINQSGWSLEMKIPYSAIRFPSTPQQVWAIQFARLIRRNREYDQWTLTPKNVQNKILYWGTMDGISNIQPPLRLSLTPYLSVYAERSPSLEENDKYQNSFVYSGGADLKYGIDERFTLDMTLLPDFSQVQSDNKVKNLSAFETIYEERRPFFKEGTSLFELGRLFYSRRIGNIPSGYYDVSSNLADGEVLEENPGRVKLLNATKVSGRTDNGLGIGLMNAITGNTYAIIKQVNGERRKVLTSPLTNYNLLVLDQQLKHNSAVRVINSSVIRNGSFRDANVTSAIGIFENKLHQYNIKGEYSNSRIHEWDNGVKQNVNGNKYLIDFNKISGYSYYGGSYEVLDKKYDKNDLSYNFTRDITNFSAYYTYNKFNPFWKHFKQGNVSIYTYRSGRLSSQNELTEFGISLSMFLLFNNNWSLYSEIGGSPLKAKDFYEPRVEGRFYLIPKSNYGSINFTTNYNKKLAFDFGGRFNIATDINNINLGYYIIPIFRVNDHFNFRVENYFDVYKNDVGFSSLISSDSILFGQRDITTIVNSLVANYIFKNDMSLSCSARHYWSKGDYNKFSLLQTDGELQPFLSYFSNDYDFNSNYLTIDLVYNWQFAPGSSFLVTYKNAINSESQNTKINYLNNLKNTFSDPQNNSISLKVIYYFDYQYLVKKKSS
jgi:hypothetical protein